MGRIRLYSDEERKERKKDYTKKYNGTHRERIRRTCKENNIKNRERYNKQKREKGASHRQLVLEHYGSTCSCCGEIRKEFLAVDHINGGGNKHKKTIGGRIYTWLIKNQFPEGFRILCHNCNQALGAYGYCPHQKEKIR